MRSNLASVLLFICSLTAFGQGQVSFNNRATTATPNPIISPIYFDSGAMPLSGTDTSFRAALLGGPTSSTAAFIPGSRTNGASGLPTPGTLSLLGEPNLGTT